MRAPSRCREGHRFRQSARDEHDRRRPSADRTSAADYIVHRPAKLFGMKCVVIACSILLATAVFAADHPSRPADKGCTWRKLSDPNLGLEAWVQRCTYSANRTIDFVAKDHALVMRD